MGRQPSPRFQPMPLAATAHLALQTAWEQAEAATKKLRGQRIFTLPSWLRMPSEQQQNWIRNSLLGLGAAYVTIFLYRQEPCCQPARGRLACWAAAPTAASRMC